MSEAYFAGRKFVLSEQDGGRFLTWETHSQGDVTQIQGATSSTVAEPYDGAFLCKLGNGWLFVAGLGRYDDTRHSFYDESPQADENADMMKAVGVPEVTREEANMRVQLDGSNIFSITGDEKRLSS